MVTMVLDVFRTELVKAVCGISEHFRKTVLYGSGSPISPITGTAIIYDDSTTVDLDFDPTGYFDPSSSDKNTIFIIDGSGNYIGRRVTAISSSPQSLTISRPFSKGSPSLAGTYVNNFYSGYHEFTMKIIKVSFGDEGHDINDEPKALTGEETGLFGTTILEKNVDDGYPLWLGDEDNVTIYNDAVDDDYELEEVQPQSAFLKVTVDPIADGISGETISEIAIWADFYNEDYALNPSLDEYDSILIGMITRPPIILSQNDKIEFYLKVNF